LTLILFPCGWQLDLLGVGVFGNKARKLFSFARTPTEALPPTIVGYGGPQVEESNQYQCLAKDYGPTDSLGDDVFPPLLLFFSQSNALAALAALSRLHHGKDLVYYTKPVPQWLRDHPIGTYRRCLELQVKVSIIQQSTLNGDDA